MSNETLPTEATVDEQREVNPDQLASMLLDEPSPTTPPAEAAPGATPPEGVPAEAAAAEPEYDFEYDPQDGTGVQRLTARQMADMLGNYNKLQSVVGRQNNELAEFRKGGPQLQTPQPPTKPLPSNTDGTVDLNTLDLDDSDSLRGALVSLARQNQALQNDIKAMPEKISQQQSDSAAEKEMLSVMSSNKNIADLDDYAKEAAVKLAVAVAKVRNEKAGRPVVSDMSSAVDMLMAQFKGETTPPVTQQGFVRNLRAPGGDVLPVSQTQSIGGLVQRYDQCTTPDEKAEFLESLDNAGRTALDAAIYARR